MIQLFAYDENGLRHELDTYKDEPILLNMAIEDIEDIQRIEAVFSRTFRLPATNRNSRFFKWWFQSGAIDFDITKIVTAEIHIDGIFFKSGQLRLQAAYRNEDTKLVDIEVAFIGETKQFGTQLGDTYMNSLNVSDTDHVLDHDFLHDSQLPFGDPNLPFEGAIRYALAIRGYTYDDSGNILENGQITFDNSRQKSFTNPTTHISETQYTPFIQVKYLIDKIFAETGYTYSDDSVFNEEWFKFLYTDGIATPSSTTPSYISDVRIETDAYPIGSSVDERLPFNRVITNNGNSWNETLYEWTATIDAPVGLVETYISIADQYPFGGGPSGQYHIKLWRQPLVGPAVVVDDDILTPVGTPIPGQQYTVQTTLSWTAPPVPGPAGLLAGEKYYVTCNTNGGENPYITNTSYFEVTGTPNAIRTSELLKTDYTKLQFFKDICTRFKLVVAPSKTTANQFKVKPWIDYIGQGDIFDWTFKMDLNKDAVMKPLFFEQSAINTFSDLEGADLMNVRHQNAYEQPYGYRTVDSNNPLLSSTRDVRTEMAPTPVNQIIGWEKVSSTLTAVVPFFATINEEALDTDGYPQLLPQIPKPRLLFWNGMRTCSWDNTQYFYDKIPPGVKHYEYPCMSYLSMLDSTPNTLDLNWEKDVQYFEIAGDIHSPDGSQGFDVYERFWVDYMNSLYSKDARMLTAYFVLYPEDLVNLTFDDIIWVKDAYWRVLRVVDAPLSGVASVKVELIKMYTYPYTSYYQAPIETLAGTSGGGGGGGEQTWWLAQNCENPEDQIIVSYPSALPLGYVIKTTGSGHIGQCYELIQTVAPQTYLPITEYYADCEECGLTTL